MLNFLKRFKGSYLLYNFFHRKQLIYNEIAYQNLGLNKKYFHPVSSKDFESLPNERSDLGIGKENLAKALLWKDLSQENRESLLAFDTNGYAVLKGYIAPETVDLINQEINTLIQTKKVRFRYGNKIMFAIHKSKLLMQIGNNEGIINLLSLLLDGKAILFQSINFLKGSQQATHSDTIHMTTYPLGGLLGVWLALEDTDADNGPLHYYPGSHHLPYWLNKDYDNEGNRWMIGTKTYKDYEKMIAEKIQSLGLKKEVFYAQKGDILIWHANLLHGGEPQLDKHRSRNSMVFHYFKQGSVCYHEITQRPALLEI
jgi:phytanoyl-CoA hydroxylase